MKNIANSILFVVISSMIFACSSETGDELAPSDNTNLISKTDFARNMSLEERNSKLRLDGNENARWSGVSWGTVATYSYNFDGNDQTYNNSYNSGIRNTNWLFGGLNLGQSTSYFVTSPRAATALDQYFSSTPYYVYAGEGFDAAFLFYVFDDLDGPGGRVELSLFYSPCATSHYPCGAEVLIAQKYLSTPNQWINVKVDELTYYGNNGFPQDGYVRVKVKEVNEEDGIAFDYGQFRVYKKW